MKLELAIAICGLLKKGSPKPWTVLGVVVRPGGAMEEITGTPARPRGTCRRSECSACPHGPRGC